MKISINGKQYNSIREMIEAEKDSGNVQVISGANNVVVRNGKVIVDGKKLEGSFNGSNVFHIVIEGNVNSVQTTSGDVTVGGNVGNIACTSGDVECGRVEGNVATTSGDISCGSVGGCVNSFSGDISYRG